MNTKQFTFTSESVSEGHPDKIADQISDAILDACLTNDTESRVACETYTTTGLILIGGEISTDTYIDIQDIARTIIKNIGYTNPNYGLDYNSMAVLNVIHAQSPDISQGVDTQCGLHQEQGAGDQGIMFGFACDETPELMPAPILYAHQILQRASTLRKNGSAPWMRPDAKSQVSILYNNYDIIGVDNVVMSQQHDENITHKDICHYLINEVIKPVFNEHDLLTQTTSYHINPTGRFVIGGPHGDAGLTGRKIIVDTYGGMSRHGGGAFSGKDPSKVDRSGAYMARYIAKNIVAAKLASRAEIQLSYAIGMPCPTSIFLETFNTELVPHKRIIQAITQCFDLSPSGIIDYFDLKRPIYLPTATYGHFGKAYLPWEQCDKVAELQRLCS